MLSAIYYFFVRRRARKVLAVAAESILSSQEIAYRTRMSKSKTEDTLRFLEQKDYLSSGYLMPDGLKIYRITKQGEAALAGV